MGSANFALPICSFAVDTQRWAENVKRSISKRAWSDEEYAVWFASLPIRPTPHNTPQDRYEIEHTGPYNYLVEGGGEKFWVDGFRDRTIVLDAKKIVRPERSPFIENSQIDERLRLIITAKVREEFRRLAIILRADNNPLTSVRVVVSEEAAREFFESLLREYQIPGAIEVVE
jgi:hypothetical protein